MRHRDQLRAVAAILVVSATACSFELQPGSSPIDGQPTDGRLVDAGADAADVACVAGTWSPSNVGPCSAGPVVGGVLVVAGGTYDTTTGVLTPAGGGAPTTPVSAVVAQSDGGVARVVALAGFTLPSQTTLQITGEHPLILLVHGDALINGTLDVSARMSATGSVAGPGAASDAVCGSSSGGSGSMGDNENGGTGGGGGGGGGFGRDGGDGGDNTGNGGTRGARGVVASDLDLVPLRGGCPGGAGGASGVGPSGEGAPGGAGGALQISVRDTLEVAGELRSAGAGGGPGSINEGGGGGGGSGGAILIEATMVTVGPMARLCANGGSGGQGAALVSGATGTIGSCSASMGATTPNGAAGGTGGGGGYRDNNSGAGIAGGNGITGGGGGGGAGRIVIAGSQVAIDPTAILSPQQN